MVGALYGSFKVNKWVACCTTAAHPRSRGGRVELPPVPNEDYCIHFVRSVDAAGRAATRAASAIIR